MSVAACGPPLVAGSRGSCLVVVRGFFFVAASLVAERTGSRALGLLSCGSRPWSVQASVVVAHTPSCPRPVRSSWTRDRTCVLCIGRQDSSHAPPGEFAVLTVLSDWFSDINYIHNVVNCE